MRSGVGKPVVSTPYVHATEILADGHGVLVDFGDVAGFARAIAGLLGSERNRTVMGWPSGPMPAAAR